MKGNTRWAVVCAMLALITAGCVTNDVTSYYGPDIANATPVVPGPGEGIITNHLVLVVDSSGSMFPKESFAVAKGLARSFVGGMPDGGYHAGALGFGGLWKGNWTYQRPIPFDRDHLQVVVSAMEHVKRSTPLPHALASVGLDMLDYRGRGAIILFSDGRADSEETQDVLSKLLACHMGELCVHTVHVGPHEDGKQLLMNMAKMSSCGTYREAADVATPEGMQAFVREVFFGPGGGMGTGVAEGDYVILFGSGKSAIGPQYASVLDEIAMILKNDASLALRIEGHADNTSSESTNQRLSLQRANAVASALVERGVARDRIDTAGYGEANPVADNGTAQGRAQNRRAVVLVIR